VTRFCDQIIVFRGSNKSPQVRQVSGQNHRKDEPLNEQALDRSMLEIINAA
jgi:hypothetical protein